MGTHHEADEEERRAEVGGAVVGHGGGALVPPVDAAEGPSAIKHRDRPAHRLGGGRALEPQGTAHCLSATFII